MSGNLLEGCFGPTTQDINSGKALAAYLGIEEDLPGIIHLVNGARLTLSSKKDAYYVTTAQGCSCKGGQYGRRCKHRKALLEDPRGQSSGKYAETDEILGTYDGPCLA